ncbi:MAG: hypothetical protein V7703_18775, partial [Hyphomicrobiales bacterium]
FNRDQEPATIPTTGQSLSSSGSTKVAAAPALNILPRAKPAGAPTELLPETQTPIQVALADTPAPRPMPAELVAMRKLAQQQSEITVAGLRNQTSTPQASQRSVENAWAQVGDKQSTTDMSQIIMAQATDDAAQPVGAPEVASAVLAALSTTRERAGPAPSDTSAVDGPEGTSAAASIAAAILAPDGGTPGQNQDDNFNG